jgi:HK97 family phage prohead protease
MEIRLMEGAELRTADEGPEKAFSGRLVPYNVWAPIGGRWMEQMSPGVFTRSIQQAATKGKSFPLHVNHDHTQLPVGRSVEWDDQPDGLYGRWVMADTDPARECHRMISEGFLSGLSVGYQPNRDSDLWETADPPRINRVTRRQARLLEVSVCSVPTWEEAVITLTRSSLAERSDLRPNLEAWQEWRARLSEIR